MKKLLLLPILLLSFAFSTLAGNERICGTDAYFQQQLQADPGLENRMLSIESFTQRFINNKSLQRGTEAVVKIPVVVHVLWKTAQQNISDAQVQSQIDVLNEDYRKLNANFSQTLPEFLGLGADYEIEFCLASTDPNGNPTNGIERKQTTKTSWGTNDAMKKTGTGGLAAWNADHYLNLWVCNLSGGVLGYATFPGGNKALDGVVILTTGFGRVGYVQSPFDLGATATHEVGHWLNLRHIWGDAQPTCGNDFVDDTPKANGPNYGCLLSKTSCSNKNMVQNYMDYSDDNCMTLFTLGQKERSRALFAPGGARYAMLSSTACGNVVPTCGTATPSVSNITASSATISFAAVSNATNYLVEMSINGGDWMQAGSGTSTSYNATDLDACKDYNVKVTTTCAGLGETVSGIITFKTAGCVNQCQTPDGIAVSNIKLKTAKVAWNAVSGAKSYDVRRKITTQSTWKQFSGITKLLKIMPGHTSNKSYEVQVRTKCASGYSEWSPSVYYTSATYREMASSTARTDMVTEASFNVYPNPASSIVNIEYYGQDLKSAAISIMDITGRTARSVVQDVSNSSNTTMDISGLSNGLYFIRIMHEGQIVDTKKLLIAK